jgi:hypothetical protein
MVYFEIGFDVLNWFGDVFCWNFSRHSRFKLDKTKENRGYILQFCRRTGIARYVITVLQISHALIMVHQARTKSTAMKMAGTRTFWFAAVVLTCRYWHPATQFICGPTVWLNPAGCLLSRASPPLTLPFLSHLEPPTPPSPSPPPAHRNPFITPSPHRDGPTPRESRGARHRGAGARGADVRDVRAALQLVGLGDERLRRPQRLRARHGHPRLASAPPPPPPPAPPAPPGRQSARAAAARAPPPLRTRDAARECSVRAPWHGSWACRLRLLARAGGARARRRGSAAAQPPP